MRTIKYAGVMAGCIGLLIFGLFIVDWLILIFIVPLLFLLFAGVLSFYDEPVKIEVSRYLSNVKIFEYDTVKVTLKLKNLGENIKFLEIYDSLPNKVKVVKGTNYSVLNLEKNEEIEIKYEISCPIRGRYSLGPLRVRVKDYFDLFYKENIVDTSSELTVIPQMEEIRAIAVKSKPNIYPGIMHTKNAGIGTEFYGIRNYTAGDTFKKINWKSFARYNDLMVNEFESESTTDAILIVDAREIQSTGTIKHNPLEYGIKAAVSIASHFLKRRDRVGLIAYGSSQGELKWVYPESGKNQLYKIIEEIVSLQANGDFPFNGVIYRSSTHLLPKKALIIFISSLENDLTIPEGIEQLIGLGHNIIILSPSPVDIEYSLQKVDTNHDLAHKLLSFKRKNIITQLRNTGARVVEWDPAQPLAVSLKEVEKCQIRR